MLMKALFLKRPFDMLLSFIGLLLSSPFWLLFSILIKAEDGGPIFYLQERVGKKGKNFNAFKFRSMIRDAEKDGRPVQATEHDPRVTRIGRIMRVTAMCWGSSSTTRTVSPPPGAAFSTTLAGASGSPVWRLSLIHI